MLVSCNPATYCKILHFLIKFAKSIKDLGKILVNWLGKRVKYWLNFINFHLCTEKWLKVGQLLSINLMKVHSIQQRFSWSYTFGLDKISSCFVSFMTEIFHFTQITQLPDWILFWVIREWSSWTAEVNLAYLIISYK